MENSTLRKTYNLGFRAPDRDGIVEVEVFADSRSEAQAKADAFLAKIEGSRDLGLLGPYYKAVSESSEAIKA